MNKGINLFLAIGINQYEDAVWTQLSNAVRDVEILGRFSVKNTATKKLTSIFSTMLQRYPKSTKD